MSSAKSQNVAKKRKQNADVVTTEPSHIEKKARAADTSASRSHGNGTHALIGPHEAIIAELSPKYNVLTASVISSTQIHKRVTQVTSHLLIAGSDGDGDGKPRIALLHARTAEVCKMITVVEQCKRLLGEQGRAWRQYNQLFVIPEEMNKKLKKKEKVEETVLQPQEEEEEEGAEDADSDSSAFEEAPSRFEKAVLPPPRVRVYKSMRIFLSIEHIPQLKSRDDVTTQSSDGA